MLCDYVCTILLNKVAWKPNVPLQTGSNALLQQQTCTSAEINCIAASPDGNALAAVDDDGCVAIISASDQHPPVKLNGMHDNICSSVVYRRHKPCQGNQLPGLAASACIAFMTLLQF